MEETTLGLEKKKNILKNVQTVDKAPGLRRGFSSVVINIPIIFPLFIKKNSLYQLEN